MRWKADNDTEFSNKHEAAREESLWDLAMWKHALTIEAEEQKEHARLESIKGVDCLKAAFARVGRKGRKPDPMGPRLSWSVSHSRAASPSPSPSSPKALDKTPTKADFVVGMTVDKDASLPVVRGLTTPIMDAQSAVAPACIERMNPPLGVFGNGSPPGPLREGQRPIKDRAADASLGEAHTSDNNSDVTPLSRPPNVPSQVIAPLSITLAAPVKVESNEERLMRIIGAALKPLQDDVSHLAGDVRHLTKRVEFIESVDDPIGDVGAADPTNWGAPHDLDLSDQHYDTHIPVDPSTWADRTMNQDDNGDLDANMEEYERKSNEPGEWFQHLFTSENGLVSGSPLTPGQLSEAAILQDLWYEFCHASHSNMSVPPPTPIFEAYCAYRKSLWDARATTFRVAQNNLIYGNGGEPAPIPVLPSARPIPVPTTAVPSRAPVSDHTRGRARPSIAQKEQLPVVSLGDAAHDPITVTSDKNTPPPTASAPWTVVGGKNGRSYAGIAAKSTPPCPTPPPQTPSLRQAQGGTITLEQLQAMTKNQVINAFNLRFTPHIATHHHSKKGVIAAYMDRASRPVTEAKSPTPPKPIQKTEYTLIRDPCAGSIAGLSGRCSDAADLVRTIQRHIAQSGAPSPAQVIGGRWSNQTSYNFVLMFNGNPLHDEVLRLRNVFAKVFRPYHMIAPLRGYT